MKNRMRLQSGSRHLLTLTSPSDQQVSQSISQWFTYMFQALDYLIHVRYLKSVRFKGELDVHPTNQIVAHLESKFLTCKLGSCRHKGVGLPSFVEI